MDSLPDRSANYLGGDFAAEYRNYIDAIVAPNKQAQVTNNTQVLGTAVETLTPSEATGDRVHQLRCDQSGDEEHPVAALSVLPVDDGAPGREWLITRMATITSLDLTPQL